VFVRDKLNPRVAYQIALAKSPPPYAGDFAGSQTQIVSNVPFTDPFTGKQLNEVFIRFDKNQVRPLRPDIKLNTHESTWFVRPGDTIRFNFRGHKFNIDEVEAYALVIRDSRNVPLQPTQLASFQIFRAPRRSASAAEELPLGSFVVLNAPPPFLHSIIDYSSGVTNSAGLALDPLFAPLNFAGDVMVTFNPQGNVERFHLGFPSKQQLAEMQLADINPYLDPRTIKYPLNPVRITVGNGSPDKPEQVVGLLVKKGREHKPSRVPLTISAVPNDFAANGNTSSGSGG
jgi:hypothetical protein